MCSFTRHTLQPRLALYAHPQRLLRALPAGQGEGVAGLDTVATEQLAAVPAVVPPPVHVERMAAVATRGRVLVALPPVARQRYGLVRQGASQQQRPSVLARMHLLRPVGPPLLLRVPCSAQAPAPALAPVQAPAPAPAPARAHHWLKELRKGSVVKHEGRVGVVALVVSIDEPGDHRYC